jgi:predicted O-methyltransferase YrrM
MKDRADSILRPEQATYLEALEPARSGLLARMEADAAARGLPISDPEVASFLRVTVRSRRPRRILELGTNIGYGAVVLAQAAGPEAHVLTFEKNPTLCREARAYIDEAGLSQQIEVREGDAIELLTAEAGPFDLAYVDCVKEDYPTYLGLLAARMNAGGVVVADNVLWKGHVAAAVVPPEERARVEALRRFNHTLVRGNDWEGVLLPLGDGIAFGVRKEEVASAF